MFHTEPFVFFLIFLIFVILFVKDKIQKNTV